MDRSVENLVHQALLDFLTWLQFEQDTTLCTDIFDGVRREKYLPILLTRGQVIEQYLDFLREHRAIGIDLEADLVGLARKVVETAKEEE